LHEPGLDQKKCWKFRSSQLAEDSELAYQEQCPLSRTMKSLFPDRLSVFLAVASAALDLIRAIL